MNSTAPLPPAVPSGPLPTTSTLIPAGIGLAITAPLTVIIDLPPLIWHIRNRNTAAASLVAWIILHNLLSFINLLIWPTDDFEGRYVGQGLCDIEVKFMVARAAALPAASLCIVRALANVMNTSKSVLIPTKAQRRRGVVMDLVWCFGLPLIMMFFHYIVQPNRYFLAGVSGCAPSFWASWLSIVLLTLPPLFLSLANAFFAILVLWRLHKYRSAFQNIMASSNTTKSRFFRLFAISSVLTIGLLPVEVYVLVTNLPMLQTNGGFKWGEVHNADTWRVIVLYHSAVFYDRWVNIACGFLVFFLFGMGRDAKKMYAHWLCACGFGRCFPTLENIANSSRRGTTGQTSSSSSKARLFFKNKSVGSSASKDTTLVSDKEYGYASPTDSTYPSIKPLPAEPRNKDPFAFLDEEESQRASSHRSMVTRLTEPFRRRSPSPMSTETGTIKMQDIARLKSDRTHTDDSGGTIHTGAWGQHESQEVLTQKGLLPDKEVLVRKEFRRDSESI